MSNTCVYGAFIAVTSLTAIITASVGLANGCSIRAVSAVSLATGIFNPISIIPQLVVSIMGLCGATTMHVVSGLTLAFSLLSFMIGSAACCSGK